MKDKLIRLFACLSAVLTVIAMVGMSSTAKAEGVPPTVNQWCDGTTGLLSFDSDGWRASFRVVDEDGSFVEKHDVASGQVVTIDGRGHRYTAVWSSLQGDDLDSAGDLKDCGGNTTEPTPTPTPTSTPTSTLTPPTLNQVCSNGQTLVSFEGQGWFADLVVTYEGEVVYSRYGANSGEVMALNAPSQYKVGWYHEPTSTEVPGHSGDLKYCGSDTEEPTEEPEPRPVDVGRDSKTGLVTATNPEGNPPVIVVVRDKDDKELERVSLKPGETGTVGTDRCETVSIGVVVGDVDEQFWGEFLAEDCTPVPSPSPTPTQEPTKPVAPKPSPTTEPTATPSERPTAEPTSDKDGGSKDKDKGKKGTKPGLPKSGVSDGDPTVAIVGATVLAAAVSAGGFVFWRRRA